SATVVPLVRSRPKLTLKLLDQFPGLPMSLPRTARSNTTMTATSVASARPGRDALPLGGATSRPSFRSGCIQAADWRRCRLPARRPSLVRRALAVGVGRSRSFLCSLVLTRRVRNWCGLRVAGLGDDVTVSVVSHLVVRRVFGVGGVFAGLVGLVLVG